MKIARPFLSRLPFAVLGLSFTLGLGFHTGCGGGMGTGGNDGQNDLGTQQTPIEHLYAKATTDLKIEIDYQSGAAPYTGSFGATGMDTWNIFQVNADSLFNNMKVTTVPNTRAQMESLTDITAQNFTVQQILDIAAVHRTTIDTADSSGYYILFLNGEFNDGMMVRNDVLGVSLGTTGVIAMFKPVIASTSNTDKVRRFVEQSTLIHEFGHAIGLVNNGISMVTPHQDSAHGNHDSNSHCVMYYANEGASAALAFSQQYALTGNEVLYDSQCLADVANAIKNGK